jgi:Tfp pilus assembly protein PilX
MAMIMAVIVLFVVLGIGIALMAAAEGNVRSAANQQGSESAYALAEAALNAQVFELSIRWPTSKDGPQPASTNFGYPYSCNAASNGYSYCPPAADLSSAYPVSSQTCPAHTKGDVWNNSSTVTNGWTTYVRDANGLSSSQSQLFSSTAEENTWPYDFTDSPNPNGGGAVWVRAVGTVNCHTAVVITRVSDQVVGLNFPKYVMNANSFTITNSGQKDIINTEDLNGNSSSISLRCAGDGGLPPNQTCAGVQNSNQVQPAANYTSNPAPTPTLTSAQMTLAKNMAIADGTYIPASTPCSTITAAQLQGGPVYIEGGTGCAIKIQSNDTINSLSSPGLLIVANGTLDFEGSLTYYGVIYAANLGNDSGPVVTLGGTSTVMGGLDVDGSAALNLGSSGNGVINCTDTSASQKCGDLEYDAAAFNGLVGFAGADPAPNSFRQLPAGQ